MRALGLVAIAVVGCARHEGPITATKDPTPLDAIVDVTPPPKPATIVVSATFTTGPGNQSVSVITRNDGDVTVSLDDELVAELENGGAWERVGEQYVTIGACDAEVSRYGEKKGRKCRTLDGHASLAAAPWLGFTCSSQCVLTCRANASHPKGRYRFVVTACGDPSTRFVSDPIDWPGI